MKSLVLAAILAGSILSFTACANKSGIFSWVSRPTRPPTTSPRTDSHGNHHPKPGFQTRPIYPAQ